MSGRILVADDDADIRLLLTTCLELEGFEVIQASDGDEVIEYARRGDTDVLVLDILMPGLSGLEVLERLRADGQTEHLPVLILTALTGTGDLVTGLGAGADDYIRKPFVPSELVARVQSALRRADQQRSRNPLTGLPGNEGILEELQRGLALSRPTALLYVDLDNFKAYNDHYGFLRGDEVLKAVARLLLDIRAESEDEVFVGHVGGDDFVLIGPPKRAESIAATVCTRFDALAPSLYDDADQEQGGIVITDRRGVPQRFGFMALSIGIAVNAHGEFAHPGEFVTVATEMKHVAKIDSSPGSRHARDRRRRDQQRPHSAAHQAG
ncbi:MAG: response regulator [Nitriliruptoraceae bacterium]